MGSAIVLQGDALTLPLPDESVDLVVTSPPYFALRSYQDEGTHYAGQVGSEETPQAFLEALWKATSEAMRVLKPTGSIFVNLGDKYAGSGGHNNSGISGGPSQLEGRSQRATDFKATRRSAPDRYNQNSGGVPTKSLMALPWRYAIGCVDQLGLILRAEIVWSKPNGLPEPVKDRVRRSHEQWFHFTKEPTYYAAMDEIREEIAPAGLVRRAYAYAVTETQKASKNPVINGEGMRPANPLGKTPGSVWSIPTEPLKVPAELGIDHFAAFPTEWPRRLILGWSPPDGVVLDPFGGTGTTALVAKTLGRVGISVDLSHDYCRLAKWRINESGHGKKALGRTWAERQEGLAV